MQLQNTEKQLQSVSKPWIFHSLQVESFQSHTTITLLLKVTENPTVKTYQASWPGPINHQPWAFSTPTETRWSVCNQLQEADPSAMSEMFFKLQGWEAGILSNFSNYGMLWYFHFLQSNFCFGNKIVVELYVKHLWSPTGHAISKVFLFVAIGLKVL